MQVCDLDGATLRQAGPKQDPFVGRMIKGRYRVLRKLGEGGMGAVYLAEQISIGRKVALKLLHGNYASDDEFIGRFRREARLAASLNHRNIVTIYDFDQGDDGSLFIAMEYVDGRSLGEVIGQDAPLDIGRVIRLGAQIAEGLDAAHRSGVIHRDIKPDNIMVVSEDYSEAVKIMDFGIARIRDFGTMSPLTRSGVIMGTPAYMAPEQAEGADVSERTDIYALGILLYEMLSGAVPFQASTPGAVLLKQMKQNPLPLRKSRREVPQPIERIIMQALEKKPQKRQQTMREIVQTLKEVEVKVTRHLPPKTVMQTLMLEDRLPENASRRKSKAVWIGLVSVVAVIGFVFMIYRFPALWGGKEEMDRGRPSLSEELQPAIPPTRPFVAPEAAAEKTTSEKKNSGDRNIQEHVNVARFYRNRGEYSDALAELDKARSIDPANKKVQDEIQRTRSACLSQKDKGVSPQRCD